jgi:hypothetical protein
MTRLTDKFHGGVPTDRFRSMKDAVDPAQIAKRHERRVLAKRAKEYMEFRRANPGYTPPPQARPYRFHDPELKRMANVALALSAVMSFLKQHAGAAPSTPASGAIEYWTNTLNNRLWYTDFNGITGQVGTPTGEYNVQDYGVLPANAAATNVTNLNALLQTGAPNGSMIFFPPGLYQFNAALTALTKDFAFQGVHNQSTMAWVASGITSTNLITLSPSGFYSSFRDMTFETFVPMTTNYVIECGNNVNTFIETCSFTGNGSASSPFSGCIDFSTGGNGAVVRACYFAGWHDIGINVAGTLASPFFSDLEMQGAALTTGRSAVGIASPNGGAILMDDCGVMKCGVNVLFNVTGVNMASVFAVNCFFDQGVTQSLSIIGTSGPALRCHFVGCWFTLDSTSVSGSAISIVGPQASSGIEFQACWVTNVSGATGTNNGFNITAGQDFTISNCQISGWSNGVNVTPSALGVCYPTIQDNTIGPTGGAGGNGVGILLNAGSVTYGNILITGNSLAGNTTALTDNSTQPTGNTNVYFKLISNNGGLLTARVANYAATAIPLTTVTNVDSRGGLLVPMNTRPSTVRITVLATNAATIQTLTATVRYGLNNTATDTAIFTQAFTAGTAALGSGTFVFEVDLETATTMRVAMRFYNGNNAATGIAANATFFASQNAATAISTAANNWLGVYFSSATAAAITIHSVKYEIVSQ